MKKLYTPQNSERGFTLVELMIGLFLGLILVAMVIPAFVKNIQSFKTVRAVAHTHENARFALYELSRSIRNTGFRGCDSKQTNIQNITGDTIFDFAQDFAGFEGSDTASIGALGYSVAASTDAITVRSLGLSDAVFAENVAATDTTVKLTANHNIQSNDIIFVGDCEEGYLFKVSSVSGGDITLANAVPSGAAFKSGTLVYKYTTTTFFIKDSGLYTNNLGATPKALYRKVNGGADQELVAGIDTLQIVYGLDTDDDGVANRFVDAASVGTDFNDVTIVRFKVAATSLDSVSDAGVLTKTFATSVNVRNFAG